MREMDTIDEKLATRFLLGDLSEENRLQLEERFFKEDRFYNQLMAIQEELADDYVQDKLSASQRAQFEETFLKSPRRRERVEFAAAFSRALARSGAVASATPVRSDAWWKPLLSFLSPPGTQFAAFASVAALAVLVGAVWLFVENRRLSRGIQQTQAEKESLHEQASVKAAEAEQKRAQLEQDLVVLRSQGGAMEAKIREKERELAALRRAKSAAPTASGIATFILTPGLVRNTDEPEKLIIPATSRSILLQLDLEREEDYRSYIAEIRTARGNLAWSRSGLALQRTNYGQAVFLTIPARLLSNGEYEVTLKGASSGKVEAVGYYYFIALTR